jgi:nitrogen fixation NifU-like protein
MDALYRDFILEHYKSPRNFGELEEHDLEWHDHNPLCGDELGVHIVVEDGRVKEIQSLGADWVIEQLGIDISPTRRKCALLSLKVMRGATTGDASWPE